MKYFKIFKFIILGLILIHVSANIIFCGNTYIYNLDSTKCVTFLRPFPLTYTSSEYFLPYYHSGIFKPDTNYLKIERPSSDCYMPILINWIPSDSSKIKFCLISFGILENKLDTHHYKMYSRDEDVLDVGDKDFIPPKYGYYDYFEIR